MAAAVTAGQRCVLSMFHCAEVLIFFMLTFCELVCVHLNRVRPLSVYQCSKYSLSVTAT